MASMGTPSGSRPFAVRMLLVRRVTCYLTPVKGGDAAVVRGVRADRGTWHETQELVSLDAAPARLRLHWDCQSRQSPNR